MSDRIVKKNVRSALTDLQALDAERADFMSVIAHQLRSPLATIRLAHQILLENDTGNLTSEQIHLLEQAEIRAGRIFDLTNDLLQSSTEEVQRTSEKKPGCLEQLVDRLLSELSMQFERKLHTVHRKYDETQLLVCFNSVAMENAILNILDNAIAYTPEQGSITISTQYGENSAVLKIADTGSGIPETEVSRLFQKFTRLETSSAQHPDGLGIGLYIAQRALEQQGGTLSYEQNTPQGAIFVMTLPVAS